MSVIQVSEKAPGILGIELNRPEKKNALTQEMYKALRQALESADADENIVGIFLSGAGECFSAGNDLNDFANAKSYQDLEPVMQLLRYLPMLKKPLIIYVEGVAVGIGATLLLHADFVIADRKTYFQMPFTKLGFCAEAGSSYLLPRLAGKAQASRLLLLSEPFNSEMAYSLGLLTHISDDKAQANSFIEEIIAALQNLSPQAVQTTKALMRQSDAPLVEAIEREAKAFLGLLLKKNGG